MWTQNRFRDDPTYKKKYFHQRVKTLRAIGCWPMIDKQKTKTEVIYSVVCLASLLNVGTGLLITFYATIKFAIEQGEIDEEVYHDIMMFVMIFQILSKMILMTSKAPLLRQLVDDLNGHMEDDYVVEQEDQEIMKLCVKYDNRLSRFFLVLSLMVLITNFARPPTVALKHYLKHHRHGQNGTYEPLLGELPSKYPFILYTNQPFYWVCYVQQFLAVVPSALSTWAADSMFCSLLYYASGHFDILINNIKEDDLELNDEEMHKRVRRFVNQHRYLIKYSELIIEAFAPIMIVQMLLGAITIGLLLIQLTLIKGSLVLLAKPMVYLLYKLLQLYVACWHGQLLSTKSQEVGNACYFVPWYQKPRQIRAQYQLMICRSQKPIEVTAAGFFQFSASRFAGILNTAYSYFTMMRTMK